MERLVEVLAEKKVDTKPPPSPHPPSTPLFKFTRALNRAFKNQIETPAQPDLFKKKREKKLHFSAFHPDDGRKKGGINQQISNV